MKTKSVSIKRFILILTLSLFLNNLAFAQTFSATTNRKEIPAGELFVLILNYSGAPTNDEPDLSPINNGFTTYSTSSSFSNNIIINGTIQSSKQWEISLISDKKEGQINIPQIKMGTLHTDPIVININNDISSSNLADSKYQNYNSDEPQYAIITQVNNSNPFVQQQVNFSIIVEDTGSLQISNPYFPDDANKDWVIKSVSTPTINTKNESGRSIREIKFYYMIFPQKSGTLKLPTAKIDAHYLTRGKKSIANNTMNEIFENEFGNLPGFFSDIFAQKTPLLLTTKESTIEVKPNPQIKKLSWWLPAKNVQISSKWESPPSQFKVGEAISRSINIGVVGALDTQIPNLKFGEIDGVKQYPEKPILNMTLKDDYVISTADISNVYIPTKSGKMTIPEIDIYWFNTNTEQVEKATLEATEIDVKENQNFINDEKEINSEPIEIDNKEEKSNNNVIVKKTNNYITLIAIFFIGTLIGYILSKKKKKTVSKTLTPLKENHKKNILEFAQKKELKNLRNELIVWASERFKDEKIQNLNDINKYISNKDFIKELDLLSMNLYSDKNTRWDSKTFIDTFEKVNNSRGSNVRQSSVLPKLYKD